jgi:uncharacterized protein
LERDEFDGFEWDDDKSESAEARWGIDFDFAARVFDRAHVERPSRGRHKEPRFVTTGKVDGYMISVVWTPRGRIRRIITAFPAGIRDIRSYNGNRKAN